jgi:tRNA pseudouridine38-40 synthase
MKLFLKIAFKGTDYCGYQVQNNAITVQQKLNEASERVFGFECDIVGCSRTDSGVHANEFCLTVSKKGCEELNHNITIDRIPLAFNAYLPDDIAVFYAKMVENSFHPRYDVKYKEYVYKIWNGKFKNPFLSDKAYKCPFYINEDAVKKMKIAANNFIGKHDFTAFMAKGSKITDATRTVFYTDVFCEGDMILFKVAADGFLYNMVRIMVGTLLDVARNSILPEDIDSIILSKKREFAGATAPACGLYLNMVSYEEYKGKSDLC